MKCCGCDGAYKCYIHRNLLEINKMYKNKDLLVKEMNKSYEYIKNELNYRKEILLKMARKCEEVESLYIPAYRKSFFTRRASTIIKQPFPPRKRMDRDNVVHKLMKVGKFYLDMDSTIFPIEENFRVIINHDPSMEELLSLNNKRNVRFINIDDNNISIYTKYKGISIEKFFDDKGNLLNSSFDSENILVKDKIILSHV